MGLETFDDFNSSDNQQMDANNGVPFQFREDKCKEGTLSWLTENFEATYRESASRLEKYRIWGQLFKGIHYRSYRDYDRRGITGNMRKPKVVDNFIWEFITRKAAQMALKSTSFSAVPWNWDDQNDINNAKACESLLKARADELELDSLHTEGDFLKYKYGTAVFMQCWDEEAGGVLPAFEELYDFYNGKIPKSIMKRIGAESVHRGDISVKPIEPWYIFPERDVRKWCNVNHYDHLEWVNIYELKERYPQTASKILQNDKLMWDMETGDVTQPTHLVALRTFYHKPTKWLPKGAKITYTEDAIHDWTDFPYKKIGGLNLVVDRDIVIEDELWGRPNITQIEQHQRACNNIESSIARDLGVGSAPKWMVPKGSVDFKVLNNEFTIAEYRGAVEPKLVTGNPISQHALTVLDRKERRMGQLMRVTDTQKGEVPAGITANAALRFLDEQATQATAEDDKARKKRIRQVYKQMASIAAQYYQETDERVIRTLGPNNEYLIKSMKKADFSQVADIQLQNSSSLPDTKTGKISTIVDMNTATQTDPVFKRDEIVRILGLGNDKEFIDQAMAAANTANAIFQEMMEGNPLPDPSPSDNLMVYYSVFTKRIQDYGYRIKANEQIQAMVQDYLTAVEMLLARKSASNAKIAQWLQTNDYYPMYFTPPAPPAPPTGTVSTDAKGVKTNNMENTSKEIEEAINQDEGV